MSEDPTTTITAASQFLDSFFTIFDTGSRSTLQPYYAPTARLTYEDNTYTGPLDIVTFLVEAPKRIEHKRARTAVEVLDDGGVLVLVTGVLEFGGRNARTGFASTFLLRPKGKSLEIVRQVSSVSFEGDEEVDLDDD